ncbi:3026_t:CDS:2, partial [Gigaspora margarita]
RFIVELEIIETKWLAEKKLKEILEKFKEKYQYEIKEITYEQSREILKQKDLQRDSWTDKD